MYLHELGYVHMDVKAENILVDGFEEGRMQVVLGTDSVCARVRGCVNELMRRKL